MSTAPLSRSSDEWFALASAIHDDALAACARYGIRPHPDLRLVAAPSPFPYYEPAANRITFGVPDVTTASGRIYWYFIQSLYGTSDLAEVAALLDALLPCVMVHELGHHLRHAYGAPIDSDFVEEQIANHIAIAFLAGHPVHRRTLPEVRRWSERVVQRGRARGATLEQLTPFRLDVGDVLLARGLATRRCLDDAMALAAAAEVPPEEALAATGIDAAEVAQAERDRAELAAGFNRAYMSDLAQYWTFGSEWLVAYIDRQPPPDLGEVLDRHLLGADWEAGRRDATRALLEKVTRGEDAVLGAAAREALDHLDGTIAIEVPYQDDPTLDTGESVWREQAAAALERARSLRRQEAGAATHPDLDVLRQALAEERRRHAIIALRAAAHADRAAVEIAERALTSPEPSHRAAGVRALVRSLGGRGDAYRAVLADEIAPRPRPRATVLSQAQESPSSLIRALATHAAGEPDPMLTTIEKLMYLRAVPTFAGLELEAVRALADLAITVTYRGGEQLFGEDDLGDCLYLITEGRVALAAGGAVLAELGSREHFGEMSLFDGGRRSASAIAVRDTTLLRIDHDDFFRLGRRHPEILAGVIAVLSERLRAANAQIVTT